jgi:hypothetical protein
VHRVTVLQTNNTPAPNYKLQISQISKKKTKSKFAKKKQSQNRPTEFRKKPSKPVGFAKILAFTKSRKEKPSQNSPPRKVERNKSYVGFASSRNPNPTGHYGCRAPAISARATMRA